jgi:hypothetical protein
MPNMLVKLGDGSTLAYLKATGAGEVGDPFVVEHAVTGTFWQATQPVSAASLPLPTGAATAASQATGNTALAAIQTALELLDNAVSGTEYRVDTVSEVASTFDHGAKSSVGTSAVQVIAASTPATRGVTVKAADDNSGTVYVGNSDVTANTADGTDGFPLAAGDALTVPVDDANKVYVRGSAAGQKVFWLVA